MPCLYSASKWDRSTGTGIDITLEAYCMALKPSFAQQVAILAVSSPSTAIACVRAFVWVRDIVKIGAIIREYEFFCVFGEMKDASKGERRKTTAPEDVTVRACLLTMAYNK